MLRDTFTILYTAAAEDARRSLIESTRHALEDRLRGFGAHAVSLQAEQPAWLRAAVASAPTLEFHLAGHRVVFAVDTVRREILVEHLERVEPQAEWLS